MADYPHIPWFSVYDDQVRCKLILQIAVGQCSAPTRAFRLFIESVAKIKNLTGRKPSILRWCSMEGLRRHLVAVSIPNVCLSPGGRYGDPVWPI